MSETSEGIPLMPALTELQIRAARYLGKNLISCSMSVESTSSHLSWSAVRQV